MAVKVKKIEESEAETPQIEEKQPEEPVKTIEIKVEQPEEPVKTEKFGIKDIQGLTEEQKKVLFEDGLKKILARAPRSGTTLINYASPEGYPTRMSGLLFVAPEVLKEIIEYIEVNRGQMKGVQLVALLKERCGNSIFTPYPGLGIVTLD